MYIHVQVHVHVPVAVESIVMSQIVDVLGGGRKHHTAMVRTYKCTLETCELANCGLNIALQVY